jgi:hypothetical protein
MNFNRLCSHYCITVYSGRKVCVSIIYYDTDKIGEEHNGISRKDCVRLFLLYHALKNTDCVYEQSTEELEIKQT